MAPRSRSAGSCRCRISLGAVLLELPPANRQNGRRLPLPALGAELGATSVSGLSAGAFMASQFQIAHSRIVIGAGIVAGGPYGCAEACRRHAFARWSG